MLRKVMDVTEIGAIFIRLRGSRTLRALEADSGINREAWRLVEIGRTKDPSTKLLLAASEQPGAPAFSTMRDAVRHDVEKRLEAAPAQEPQPA